MDNKQLEQLIIKALDDNKFGSFGTIEEGNKPKVRYMAIFHEGLKIYLATNRKTHKVEELSDNPNAFVLLGYEIAAEAKICWRLKRPLPSLRMKACAPRYGIKSWSHGLLDLMILIM